MAQRIADGVAVDWDAQGPDSPGDSLLLSKLRSVERVARAHRGVFGAPIGHPPDAAPREGWAWGPLRVFERIGSGAFGEVFRAHDPVLQRDVALKLRHPHRIDHSSGMDRYLSEARRLARVNHRNVIAIHGADIHDGRVGLWMDRLDGTTLEARLERGELFGPAEAVLIGLDLCRALAAVHRAGLVHRDLKTSNVLCERGGRIVLLDFGAGTDLPGPGIASETRAVYGTLATAAPEMLRGEPGGPSVDLYALGVLLYRLVTGHYPVESRALQGASSGEVRGGTPSLRDLRPDVSSEFVEVIEHAMAPDPSKRYASAGEMERALRACLVVETTDPSQRRMPRPSPRVMLMVAALALTAGAFLAAQIIETARRWESERNRPHGAPGVGLVYVNDVAVCTAPREQLGATVASDGNAGAIAVWEDRRSGESKIYAQRLTHLGIPLWVANGVPVSTARGAQRLSSRTASGKQQAASVVPDGSGGAFIAWSGSDGEGSSAYVQRLTSAGEVAPGWPSQGVRLTDAPGDELDPAITPDGSGGAVVAWRGSRPGSHLLDIYAQRVTGEARIAEGWPAGGVIVCGADGDQQFPMIVGDGSGGAILAWYDFRADAESDVFAQRIGSDGIVRWAANGVPVAQESGAQADPMLLPDGDQGAYIVWADARMGAKGADIYAIRLGGDGKAAPGWANGGVPVCAAPGNQRAAVLASDLSGGVIVAWTDLRNQGDPDVYAQRLAPDGRRLWARSGVAVRAAPGPQHLPTIASDGFGGAVIAYRSGNPDEGIGIWAQRLGPDGHPLWPLPGLVVSRGSGERVHPFVTHGAGNGAIAVWMDGRGGNYMDIFGAAIASTGPHAPAHLARAAAGIQPSTASPTSPATQKP